VRACVRASYPVCVRVHVLVCTPRERTVCFVFTSVFDHPVIITFPRSFALNKI